VLSLNPSNGRAKQGLAALEPTVKPAWRCPLCDHASFQKEATCPGCKAVVSLDNPAAFDKPSGVDRAAVETAARRLHADLTAKPTVATAYALGLAYLNLGYVEEGIATLRSTTTARTADSRMAVAVERLAMYHQRRAAEPQARPKVMIVDDSPTVRKLVTSTLTAAGYQVVESGDGYEAAQMVRLSGPPRLFLLDVNMPGMDGFELCKLFRGSPETAKVPVVFLTGKDGFFNKLRGQWAGAAEYLTKPFDPARLVQAVSKLVPAPAATA
jgi:twitching motility two-component system response regulator PilG